MSGSSELHIMVLQAAAQDVLAHPCPDADAAVRQDLTHMTVLAIDDASTLEVDDGVSAEVLADGQVYSDVLWYFSVRSAVALVLLSTSESHGQVQTTLSARDQHTCPKPGR